MFSICLIFMSILRTNQDLKQIVLNLYAAEKVNLVSTYSKVEQNVIVCLYCFSTWSYRSWVLVRLFANCLFYAKCIDYLRGDYRNCDIPPWTAEVILKYAAELENVIINFSTHTVTESFYFSKIDFIYYTGDLPAHNVWNQSRSDQLYSINTINNMLFQIFPNKTFYSAVGNHETGINAVSILFSILTFSFVKLHVICFQHQMLNQIIYLGYMKH
jgi:hypothetical protein